MRARPVFLFCQEKERDLSVGESIQEPSNRAQTVPSGCAMVSFRALDEGKSEERGLPGCRRDECDSRPTTERESPSSQCSIKTSQELAHPYLFVSTLCFLESKAQKCSLPLVMNEKKQSRESSARSTKGNRGRSAGFLPHAEK